MRYAAMVVAGAALLFAPALAAQGELVPCPRIGCPVGRPCPPCVADQVQRVRSDVRASLADRVVRYEIRETFLNRGGGVGEADYLLPLPRGAAFRDLRLFIDGEPIAGEILPADRARAIYEEIVRSRRDPALVEWMGHGLLRARIFPIAPGERKEVLVRYDVVAEREGDALRIDHFRGRRTGQPQLRPAPAIAEEDGLRAESFVLRYPAGFGRAYSPTHRLTISDSGSSRFARIAGPAAHVTVLLPVPRPTTPALAAVAHAAGTDRHVLITISPPATRVARVPRDVTLVLDVSGSMSGPKIRQARDAGIQVLRTLDSGDRFRLIEFASDVRPFSETFQQATAGNIERGVRYLRSLTAGGGTNIEEALREALAVSSPADRLPLVLFVTDGMPTVGETRAEVLAEMVADRRRSSRIFTFGVGADVNVALLEQLAIDGRGTAQFVRDDESLEHAVGVTASRLAEPLLTDVRIDVPGVRIRDAYPRLPADVFAGQDLILLARYEGSGSARVRVAARAGGRPVSFESVVLFPASERRNDFVPRLWATRRIGHLMTERRRSPDTRELDEEIRNLALRYGLPSDQASYLVLEPGVMPPPVAAAPGDGAARARRAPANGRLEEVVVTSAPSVSGRAAFESARQASGQMAAATVADAPGTKSVAGRSFTETDWGWVQVSPGGTAGAAVIRIKPFSAAYFEIMDMLPELRAAFALGERVRVHGRSLSIETVNGGVETLSDSLRRDIRRDW